MSAYALFTVMFFNFLRDEISVLDRLFYGVLRFRMKYVILLVLSYR